MTGDVIASEVTERRTQGPLIEMLLGAGCSTEHCRGTIRFFTEHWRPDMIHTIGEEALDEFERVSLAALGLARYTVEVDYTDRTRLDDGNYRTERCRVIVEATSPTEAELVGTQMVAAVRDPIGGMPLASRIVV